jgi:uncharacterized membrane protein YdbT with pleckstrin-like domain
MEVSATGDDLGQHDISTPRVAEVVRDQHGGVESVVVEKGVIFKKKLTVPTERIASVEADPPDGSAGTLTIAANESELDALTAAGTEELTQAGARMDSRLLKQVEETVPTAEGMRRKEAKSVGRKRQPQAAQESTQAATTARKAPPSSP